MKYESFDASNPPSKEDANKLIAQLAEVLGVDPSDHDAIEDALQGLFAAAGDRGGDGDDSKPTGEQALRALLTPEQRRIIDSQRCSARNFLLAKLTLNK